MRINQCVVIEIESNRVVRRDSCETIGSVALCKGGSSGGGTSSTQNTIAPELQPLFAQTGSTIMDLQPGITDQFSSFFAPNVQAIPGFTEGQQQIADFQQQQAFGPILNSNELAAQSQLMSLLNSPVGSSPMTIAAMDAARTPVLNDLALAGLGNSDAVGTNLAGAFSPILAQEMAMRMAAIPMLQQLGSTEANRQSQYLSEYGTTEEAQRAIQEAQGAAAYNDFLRLQGLGTQFSTGLLGNFPSITGSTTTSSTNTSGGGK